MFSDSEKYLLSEADYSELKALSSKKLDIGDKATLERLYTKLVSIEDKGPKNLANLAFVCIQLGNIAEAEKLLLDATSQDPSNYLLNYNLGLLYLKSEKYKSSILSFKSALKQNPYSAISLNGLGLALQKSEFLEMSISCFRKSILIKPDYFDAHNNLGVSYLRSTQLDLARISFKYALKLKPDSYDAWSNLGIVFKGLGDFTESILSFERALELCPYSHHIHLNYSFVLLLAGNFRDGWREFSWRNYSQSRPDLNFCQTLNRASSWNRETKLVINSQQGLGDTLQFIRYLKDLGKRHPNFILTAPEKLLPLLTNSGIPCISKLDRDSPFSNREHVDLMSLPALLDFNESKLDFDMPYIHPSSELVEKWRSRFKQLPCRGIVGVNWSGNRDDLEKRGRNFPIIPLIRILHSLDLYIVFLQRNYTGSGNRPLPLDPFPKKCQQKIYDLADSDYPNDFLEYASIVGCCDLVISSATTLSHLAGAMGIPTWTLVPKSPDWRWGFRGSKSLWYPTMKLYRQKNHGDWSYPLIKIKKDLKDNFDPLP